MQWPLPEHCQSLWQRGTSAWRDAWEWHTSLLLMLHCSKQVIHPCLRSAGHDVESLKGHPIFVNSNRSSTSGTKVLAWAARMTGGETAGGAEARFGTNRHSRRDGNKGRTGQGGVWAGKRISESSAGARVAVQRAGAQREMWWLSPPACQCLVSYVSCLLDSCIKYLLIDW